MKWIQKQTEPEIFITWKQMANENWQPSWNDLRDDMNRTNFRPKTVLHQALLHEQGYICCYCGRRIRQNSSHIEHFKPRQKYPLLGLDYNNLLASCPGYLEDEDAKALTEMQAPQAHCGPKKGNWYDPKLMVSPLDQDCESYFRYTAAGEIFPNSDSSQKKAAQETIYRLGLNHPNLIRARRDVIEGLLTIIDDLNTEDIVALIQSYEQLNTQGEYVRFCAVVLYFLKAYQVSSK